MLVVRQVSHNRGEVEARGQTTTFTYYMHPRATNLCLDERDNTGGAQARRQTANLTIESVLTEAEIALSHRISGG